MECPRANRLFACRLATRVPRAGRQARSRPERAEDAARPEDCHPGRAHLRDPGPRNAGEGSVLGPGSPKLRTRNFSGRDDKRWNAHAPTNSLLGAWRHASRAPAAKRGAGRNARVMQRDRRIVIPGEPTCETRDPGTQAKEVYWVPALQNCARAISPAGMTNDGMPTRQPTLCLSLGDTRPARRPPSAEPAGTRGRCSATGGLSSRASPLARPGTQERRRRKCTGSRLSEIAHAQFFRPG